MPLPTLQRLPITKLSPDPDQPRKAFGEAALLQLAASLAAHGQKQPVSAFRDGDGYRLVDGERRYRAARIAGLAELDVLVYDGRPTRRQVLLTQAAIDLHQEHLSAMERSRLLTRIRAEENCTLTEVCALLNVSQPTGSKLAKLQQLCPELQAKVDAGWDVEKAVVVAAEPDPARQLELARRSDGLSRSAVRRQVRAAPQGVAVEQKLSVARFALPGGYTVSLTGGAVDLSTAADIMAETLRLLRKGLAQRLTLDSQIKVMRDTAAAAAKATPTVPAGGRRESSPEGLPAANPPKFPAPPANPPES